MNGVTGNNAVNATNSNSSLTTASATSGQPQVDGQRIMFPTGDWFEVQSSTSFNTMSEGRNGANMPNGSYTVINHTTGERFENVVVGGKQDQSNSSPKANETPAFEPQNWTSTPNSNAKLTTASAASGQPQVDGQRITFPTNDWFEVQSNTSFNTMSEGRNGANMPNGSYTVINHTTGERFENVVVGTEQGQTNLSTRGPGNPVVRPSTPTTAPAPPDPYDDDNEPRPNPHPPTVTAPTPNPHPPSTPTTAPAPPDPYDDDNEPRPNPHPPENTPPTPNPHPPEDSDPTPNPHPPLPTPPPKSPFGFMQDPDTQTPLNDGFGIGGSNEFSQFFGNQFEGNIGNQALGATFQLSEGTGIFSNFGFAIDESSAAFEIQGGVMSGVGFNTQILANDGLVDVSIAADGQLGVTLNAQLAGSIDSNGTNLGLEFNALAGAQFNVVGTMSFGDSFTIVSTGGLNFGAGAQLAGNMEISPDEISISGGGALVFGLGANASGALIISPAGILDDMGDAVDYAEDFVEDVKDLLTDALQGTEPSNRPAYDKQEGIRSNE